MIRCSRKGHRVGLDPARFWRPARCPACHAAVDPLRLRRAWWWLRGAAPRSRIRFGRLGEWNPIDGLIVLLTLGLLVIAALVQWTGDRWWVGTVMIFAGRWIWLVPGIPVALLALVSRRPRSVGLLLLPAAVGFFWVMGGSLGLGRFFGGGMPETRIRIVTYNVASGESVVPNLPLLLDRWRPDILAVQECGSMMKETLGALAGYRSHLGTTCLLSRYPIESIEQLPRQAIEVFGGSGLVTRYRIAGPGGPFDFTNVHLDTPRSGFEALLRGDFGATEEIQRGIVLREIESRQARRWVDEGAGPSVVAGDFNLPSESMIFQDQWGDLTDAFEAAGAGFGATRFNGWIRVRIDHVLADDRWVVRRALVLPDYGSDHRPLFAEIERRR